ncbi:hypothetical protein LB505_004838 [Fusarium chuoi]|nr:hypothetical protein LB505_004838 [Fusarium chuoi]
MSAPISSTNGDGQTNGHSHDETATQNGNGVSQEQTNGANPQQNGQEHHHDHGIKRPAKIGTGLKDRDLPVASTRPLFLMRRKAIPFDSSSTAPQILLLATLLQPLRIPSFMRL